MDKNNGLTVGIVTFNSQKYITELLDSVFAGNHQPQEVIIVDNASTDETQTIIRQNYREYNINLISLEQNIGHSAACNIIIEQCQHRFLALLDHDVELKQGTLEELMASATAFSEDEIAVTGRILATSKHDASWTYGSDLHFLTSSVKRNKFIDKYTGNCPTTCVIIDMDKLGETRFDEDFFIYINDLDFFYRLRLQGFRLLINPRADIIHKDGTPSLSSRVGQPYSPLRAYYMTRNRLLFYFKNYSIRTLLILLPALVSFELVALIFSIRKGLVKKHILAINDFVRFTPQFRAKRNFVQRNRVASDKACLSGSRLQLSAGASAGNIERSVGRILQYLYRIYFRFVYYILA